MRLTDMTCHLMLLEALTTKPKTYIAEEVCPLLSPTTHCPPINHQPLQLSIQRVCLVRLDCVCETFTPSWTFERLSVIAEVNHVNVGLTCIAALYLSRCFASLSSAMPP